MEVKIRHLDSRAVKILDEEATKQRISRNEILKRIVERNIEFEGIKSAEKELDTTLHKVGNALEMTFNRLDKLEKRTEKMFVLLCDVSGLDPIEVNQMLDTMLQNNKKEGILNEYK